MYKYEDSLRGDKRRKSGETLTMVVFRLAAVVFGLKLAEDTDELLADGLSHKLLQTHCRSVVFCREPASGLSFVGPTILILLVSVADGGVASGTHILPKSVLKEFM